MLVLIQGLLCFGELVYETVAFTILVCAQRAWDIFAGLLAPELWFVLTKKFWGRNVRILLTCVETSQSPGF